MALRRTRRRRTENTQSTTSCIDKILGSNKDPSGFQLVYINDVIGKFVTFPKKPDLPNCGSKEVS